MSYNELARKLKAAYEDLKKDTIYNVVWNNELEISEITVKNDSGFRAIIIGNTNGGLKSRGYMYLFYTNDDNVSFPTIKEIERRLKIVAAKEVLTGDDVSYYDWEEYGTLEKQREYFSEIILKEIS